MLTVIGVILVVAACIGFVAQQIVKQRKRLTAMGDFCRLLTRLSKTMGFTKAPLPTLFAQISGEEKNEAGRFLAELNAELSKKGERTLPELWQEKVTEFAERLSFLPPTEGLLKNAGKHLGMQSEEEEIKSLEKAAEELEQQLKLEKESALSNEKLLKSAGILAGLFIVIIFI